MGWDGMGWMGLGWMVIIGSLRAQSVLIKNALQSKSLCDHRTWTLNTFLERIAMLPEDIP